MHWRYSGVLFFICLSCAFTAEANDTVRLEEVAVSVLPFNQTYQESAGAVFLLNPESIDLKHLVNTTELFNLVPGVYMAAGTYNTNRLVIRGVGSRTPYNTNRIRAYLDDICCRTVLSLCIECHRQLHCIRWFFSGSIRGC